jgi:hypothetical protein
MGIIYLLELEKSKYFLLSSNEENISPVYLFLYAYLSSDFVQKYKPVNVVKQWSETHKLDLDILVKKNMINYGINNVRGGSYNSYILTDEQKYFLNVELNINNNIDDISLKNIVNDFFNKHKNIQYMINEREQIISNYKIYKNERYKLGLIQCLDIDLIRQRLDWVKNTCKTRKILFSSNKSDICRVNKSLIPDINDKYNEVIISLNNVYNTFNIITENLYEESCFIKYPRFILDDFIYNGFRSNEEKSMVDLDKLYDRYQFILNVLENKQTDYLFDVSSWGKNPQFVFESNLLLLGLSI